MSNPMLDAALAMARAIAALKLKPGGRLIGTHEGTRIVQRGKPDLLLTWEAAREFSNMVDEAEA